MLTSDTIRMGRELHPEEKPQEFQALYCAYQAALQYASSVGKGPARGGRAPEAEQKNGLDTYEKQGKHGFEEEGVQALYRSLQAASGEELSQQKIKEINEFLENWRIWMTAWRKGGGFLVPLT